MSKFGYHLLSLKAPPLPNEEELAVAKGYLTGAYELGLEDSGARMSRLGGMLTLHGSIRPIDEQLDRWHLVDADATARVASMVLSSPRVGVTLGPA